MINFVFEFRLESFKASSICLRLESITDERLAKAANEEQNASRIKEYINQIVQYLRNKVTNLSSDTDRVC
jgi:hypothetical protein